MLFGQPQSAPDFSRPPSEWVQPDPTQLRGLHITRPVWSDLSNAQQHTLAGLKEIWPYISSAEKRRWLALAREVAQLDPAQASQVMANIGIWANMSESDRQAVRQLLSGVDAQQLASISQAWQAYSALDAQQRRALLQKNRYTSQTSARTSRKKTRVTIRAAAQVRPGLSNLPKIPLEPVRYADLRKAVKGASPASGAAAAPAVRHVQEAEVVTTSPGSPAQPRTSPRVTYWHGIPITPPADPPVYQN
ncbi:hypothetical protein AAV94_06690 [Lampropedia cohaerens]|uniref:DUF3106 domain-containing protein n=2 Tax=Lampropedia cohaerens TaxID=1610491 RepID=A0A0U1Q063_9BURK|nr:hypothetical protein AAV94_06690 [Lampropedia cohaerens]